MMIERDLIYGVELVVSQVAETAVKHVSES